MRVATKKLEGVDSVEVSLNEGFARVTFKADNRVTIEQVRQAIRVNGFTPKAADVRIAGRIIEEHGKLILAVPGQDRPFTLVEHPEAPGALQRLKSAGLGKPVIIEGTTPETPKRDAPDVTIKVRRFILTPGA